jgi:ubiquinone/menaquinone biosynthesis C-methylase UbiE
MATKQLPESPAPVTLKAKPKPPISAWLSELEQKNAKEFERRTGLEYKPTITQIVEAAELQPDARVLDVGTGTGLLARHLAGQITARGKVIGIDSTKEQVDRARMEAQSAGLGLRVEWRVVKTKHWPFDAEEFDLVTCCLAFHQFPAAEFMHEAFRVLKPGGALLVATEVAPKSAGGDLRLKVRRGYYQLVARNQAEAEAEFHTSDEITDLLRETGFRQSLVRELRRQSLRHARAFMLIKAVK